MSFRLMVLPALALHILAATLPSVASHETRRVLDPFSVNSTGEIQGRLAIEHHGLAQISFAPYRPIDNFLLNGNTLIAEDRNGSCYVDPNTKHLHCEDIPDDVPRSATMFGVDNQGLITFAGSPNWHLCPAQNPMTYDVYRNNGKTKKPSPYCKDGQLKVNSVTTAARSPIARKSDTESLSEKDIRHCPFVLHVIVVDQIAANKIAPFGPFVISGRSLLTSNNFEEYCFIEGGTRRLLCRPKSDPLLMDNWHTINFSLTPDKTLQHGSSNMWLVCQDKTGGQLGPFISKDSKEFADCASKIQPIRLKAQHAPNRRQCQNLKWTAKDSKPFDRVFSYNHLTEKSGNSIELRQRAPICPTNLKDTLFKSPSLVVPIALRNSTVLSGNREKIVVLPDQSVTLNFFIPYTTPYFGKTCSLLFLIPYAHEMEVKPQTVPPALQISILDGPIHISTNSTNLPKGHVLGTRKLTKDIKVGEDNSLVTFPCQAGTTMSFLVESKGGLSLIVRQAGVPTESGLHIVPCN